MESERGRREREDGAVEALDHVFVLYFEYFSTILKSYFISRLSITKTFPFLFTNAPTPHARRWTGFELVVATRAGARRASAQLRRRCRLSQYGCSAKLHDFAGPCVGAAGLA